MLQFVLDSIITARALRAPRSATPRHNTLCRVTLPANSDPARRQRSTHLVTLSAVTELRVFDVLRSRVLLSQRLVALPAVCDQCVAPEHAFSGSANSHTYRQW
jgi:hypothetical protein